LYAGERIQAFLVSLKPQFLRWSSVLEGNLVIQRLLSLSKMVAFGLAPPSEETVAIKTDNHVFTSSLS